MTGRANNRNFTGIYDYILLVRQDRCHLLYLLDGLYLCSAPNAFLYGMVDYDAQ